MAKAILNATFISIATNDLSDRCRSIALEMNGDIVDVTCMTDTYKDKLAGLTDWKVTVEFAQDYAAGSVDAILFPLVGTSVALVIRPTQAAAGADNPEFTGNAFLTGYSPLDGKVSEGNFTKCTFEGAGALGRAVA